MNPRDDHDQLRKRYLIALIEATVPLQQQSDDRELTLELLIQAADLLRDHLQKELQELRTEEAD